MTKGQRILLLVLAMLCFLVSALLGFDVLIHGSHVLGWLSAGLVLFAASTVPA